MNQSKSKNPQGKCLWSCSVLTQIAQLDGFQTTSSSWCPPDRHAENDPTLSTQPASRALSGPCWGQHCADLLLLIILPFQCWLWRSSGPKVAQHWPSSGGSEEISRWPSKTTYSLLCIQTSQRPFKSNLLFHYTGSPFLWCHCCP